MALRGTSIRRIEQTLNTNGGWVPAKKLKNATLRTGVGWRASYVKKILHNPAVLGVYQPYKRRNGDAPPRAAANSPPSARLRTREWEPVGEPIADYYPAVVSPDIFYAVQEKLAGNRRKGGQTGAARNVLTHIVKCAYCGGPMRYEDKGKKPKGSAYLVCDNATRLVAGPDGQRLCSRHPVRYKECLTTILENCQLLRPEAVLAEPAEHAERCQTLRDRISGAIAELSEIENQLENLTVHVAHASSEAIARRIFGEMERLEKRKGDLGSQWADDERELRAAEAAPRALASWTATLEKLKVAIVEDDPRPRLRLRAHLREFIASIEVFSVGFKDVYARIIHRPLAWSRRFSDGDKLARSARRPPYPRSVGCCVCVQEAAR